MALKKVLNKLIIIKLLQNYDLPAFGNPTNPAAAITRISKTYETLKF